MFKQDVVKHEFPSVEFINEQYNCWFAGAFNDAMYRHFNDDMPDRRCNIEAHMLRVRLWRNL